ncbi:MAG: hypothetical protein CSA26_01130 [Desulfobacterales bacterium]|nr:MAG: hypothetical protein CSA26_01130 [Desulfobacterales bacterium]
MLDTSIPIINEDFIAESFENEILLYTIADTKAVYLNETAHLVWKLCIEKKSVGEMITFLESTYPDQQDVIRADVIETLSNLAKIEAISFTDD